MNVDTQEFAALTEHVAAVEAATRAAFRLGAELGERRARIRALLAETPPPPRARHLRAARGDRP
jgi:hypothetical protein